MQPAEPHPWTGVFPATLCPFHEDESLDEQGLRAYFAELAVVDGVRGLVCNGHTGEVMSLRPRERARVTQVLAQTLREIDARTGHKVKAISGVSAEGSHEATDHALEAKAAGADAILLMPPHHWLRFGRSPRTAVGFIQDVAAGANVPIIVHQYPAWTKAGYSLAEMLEMVQLPQVVMVKMGTRDLPRARQAQRTVAPLARLIYNGGEPGCAAHQRMKVARWLLGEFPSPVFRRPVRPLPPDQIEALRSGLRALDFQPAPG